MAGLSHLAHWRNAVRDSELSWRAKLTGHTLSTYMDSRGFAFPAKETLAAGAGVSVRTIDAGIAELQLAGLLGVEKSRGRVSHRYLALLPNPAHGAGLTTHEVPGWSAQPGTAELPTRHDTHSNPARRADESDLESESESDAHAREELTLLEIRSQLSDAERGLEEGALPLGWAIHYGVRAAEALETHLRSHVQDLHEQARHAPHSRTRARDVFVEVVAELEQRDAA